MPASRLRRCRGFSTTAAWPLLRRTYGDWRGRKIEAGRRWLRRWGLDPTPVHSFIAAYRRRRLRRRRGETDSSGMPPVTTLPFGKLTTSSCSRRCETVRTRRTNKATKVQLKTNVAIPVSTPAVVPITYETIIATPKPSAAAATWILRSVRLNSTVSPSGHPSIAKSGLQPPSGRDAGEFGRGSLAVPGPQQPCCAPTYLRRLEGRRSTKAGRRWLKRLEFNDVPVPAGLRDIDNHTGPAPCI